MLKSTFALAAIVLAVTAVPALAQTATPPMKMSCTDADMAKMDADMMKMTDAAKKDGAMKEMAMAKEMMAKKDMAGCEMHMGNAMKMMPN